MIRFPILISFILVTMLSVAASARAGEPQPQPLGPLVAAGETIHVLEVVKADPGQLSFRLKESLKGKAEESLGVVSIIGTGSDERLCSVGDTALAFHFEGEATELEARPP